MPKLGVSIESRLDRSQFKKDVADLKSDINSIESKLGNATRASDNFGKALSDAIPVALIEQAIQRTGEWAVNLQRSAEQVRATTTDYQILKTLFERTHLDEGNIKNFFDKLNAAATEAVSGNMELAASFARLGVQLKDLKTLGTSGIFEKIMGKGSSLSTQGLAIEKVFGKESITDVQNLAVQFTGGKAGNNVGGSLKNYAENVGVGVPTVNAQDVQSMADSWSNFVLHMKELGSALSPIATLVLNIVNGLAAMLSGVINTIKGIGDDVIHGNWFKLAGRIGGMGAGIAKTATFGMADKYIDKYIGDSYKTLGLSNADVRAAQGAGAAVLTGIVGGTSAPGNLVASGLEKVGMESLGGAVRGATAGQNGILSKLTKSGYEGALDKTVLSSEKSILSALDSIGVQYDTVEGTFLKNGNALSDETVKRLLSKKYSIDYVAAGTGYVGIAAMASNVNKSDVNDILHPEYPPTNRGLGQFGFGTMGNIGAGGPNLSFGGVYGADIQSRLLVLNEQMVNLLTQIVYNTGGKQGVNIGVINQPLAMH